jgi:hypothetical protein
MSIQDRYLTAIQISSLIRISASLSYSYLLSIAFTSSTSSSSATLDTEKYTGRQIKRWQQIAGQRKTIS